MISKVSGLGGAYCSMCVVSVADAHNPEQIKQGFTIDRSIESTWQLYENLKDDDGNVPRAPGD
jgi:hypothetical protein